MTQMHVGLLEPLASFSGNPVAATPLATMRSCALWYDRHYMKEKAQGPRDVVGSVMIPLNFYDVTLPVQMWHSCVFFCLVQTHSRTTLPSLLCSSWDQVTMFQPIVCEQK